MITLGEYIGPWIPRLAARPTKATAGVPAGVSLTTFSGTPDAQGNLRLTTPNTTYTGVLFPAPVIANASGLVFQSCKFMPSRPAAGAASAAGLVVQNAAGITVAARYLDCEFHGNGEWADAPSGTQGVAAGSAPAKAVVMSGSAAAVGYTMRRCYLHDMTHCIDVTSNITIESCYMDNPVQYYDVNQEISHNDILQFYGGGASNVVFLNNVLDNYNRTLGINGNTSAIQWGSGWSAGAVLYDILIAANYINGGGYSFNGLGAGHMAPVDIQRVRVIRNRWGLDNQFGPVTNPTNDPRVIWANNVFDVSGSTRINSVLTTVTAGQSV